MKYLLTNIYFHRIQQKMRLLPINWRRELSRWNRWRIPLVLMSCDSSLPPWPASGMILWRRWENTKSKWIIPRRKFCLPGNDDAQSIITTLNHPLILFNIILITLFFSCCIRLFVASPFLFCLPGCFIVGIEHTNNFVVRIFFSRCP